MPLTAGDSDKTGNRYEARWTVLCMAEVMSERADSIRLEPPGPEGEGAEFWLRRGSTLEYHQVKRQRSEGRWDLAALEGKGVLSNFYHKLSSDPEACCVFVSSDRAYQLDELAYRARGAATYQEFEAYFLRNGKNDPWLATLNKLRGYWANCTAEDAYIALRRVDIQPVGERTLDMMVMSGLETLVDGNPGLVSASLTQLAYDSIHQELTAVDIWHHLETMGFHPREWGKNPRVLSAVDKQNNLYADGLRDAAISSEMIPRSEVAEVMRLFEDMSGGGQARIPDGEQDGSKLGKRAALLVGEAGIGKSGVILGLNELLRGVGIPHLAFRVDKLTPTYLPEQVGAELGLPGSPANVLASIAHNRPCVLIIDQLDAVSLASGRNADFFECVHGIIRQALAHPNIFVLLACRKFDLENDSRLRRLSGNDGVAETVPVGKLSHAVVCDVVSGLGLDAGKLKPKQIDLLSVPLHLRLLVDVAEDRSIDALDFKTAKDLYDNFWDQKRRILTSRGQGKNWTEVIDTLCAYMSEHQVLFVPKEMVEQYAPDADAMASEHVLTYEGARYAFFHEGFFDYAFARRFTSGSQSLVGLLHERGQHLFRRAQVRQVLLYLRDMDRVRYIDELRSLLLDPEVRIQIKTVVFGLLHGLADPSWQEWEVLNAAMSGSDEATDAAAWNTLLNAVPWFDLLHGRGVVAKWLRSADDKRLDRVAILLSTMQRIRSDLVAELMGPYIDVAPLSDRWRYRFLHIIQWGECGASRRFLDLFLRLIDNGVLDDARAPIAVNADFWMLIHDLPDKHPEWAAEVIGHYLARRLQLSQEVGNPDVFDMRSDVWADSGAGEDNVLVRTAQRAPREFVNAVLPPMLGIMDLTAPVQGEWLWQDAAWAARLLSPPYDTRSALLAAMVYALSQLAQTDGVAFGQATQQLQDCRFDTANFLLIRGYGSAGQAFADEAARYLCDVPDRLGSGYADSYDAHFWAARQLIEAISPHCSAANLAHLEDTILAYYPPIERTWVGKREWEYPLFGRAQYVLLEGIDPIRRSRTATKRLEELRRKLVGQELTPPTPQPFSFIFPNSPIAAEAAEKMTDAQWLKAMGKYTTFRHGRTFGSGSELSGVFREQVGKEPERFAALMLRFPDHTDIQYFGAVLIGLAYSGYDVDCVVALCEHCHKLPGRPCGHYIVQAIAQLASASLPEKALQLVAWYAVEGDDYARSAAAEAMAQLIRAEPGRCDYFLPTLRSIAAGSAARPTHSIVWALKEVLEHDRDLGIALFVELCEHELATFSTPRLENAESVPSAVADSTPDSPIKGSYTGYFLLDAVETHFGALAPVLKQMIASPIAEVARVGALAVCKAAVIGEEARPLATKCIEGGELQQKAAAEVMSANIRFTGPGGFCVVALSRLFDSDFETVRSSASACFGHLWDERSGGASLQDHTELIAAFMGSRAFAGNVGNLVFALEQTTAQLPDVTCEVCERFLEFLSQAPTDVREKVTHHARSVIHLLVRVYGHALEAHDAQRQTKCLDLLDRAAAFGTSWLDDLLATYER